MVTRTFGPAPQHAVYLLPYARQPQWGSWPVAPSMAAPPRRATSTTPAVALPAGLGRVPVPPLSTGAVRLGHPRGGSHQGRRRPSSWRPDGPERPMPCWRPSRPSRPSRPPGQRRRPRRHHRRPEPSCEPQSHPPRGRPTWAPQRRTGQLLRPARHWPGGACPVAGRHRVASARRAGGHGTVAPATRRGAGRAASEAAWPGEAPSSPRHSAGQPCPTDLGQRSWSPAGPRPWLGTGPRSAPPATSGGSPGRGHTTTP